MYKVKNVNEELEKTEKKRLLQNQKIFKALAILIGKDELYELTQFLGVSEELFDPDEGCDVISCPICGACGSSDALEWNEGRDVNGKQLTKEEEDEMSEGLITLYLWQVTCRFCGNDWSNYFRRSD